MTLPQRGNGRFLPFCCLPSALVGKYSELIGAALLRQVINDVQPNVGLLLCENHKVFGTVWLIMYKCMKCHVVCNTMLLSSVARSVCSETSVAELQFKSGSSHFFS